MFHHPQLECVPIKVRKNWGALSWNWVSDQKIFAGSYSDRFLKQDSTGVVMGHTYVPVRSLFPTIWCAKEDTET
jgi:hypothetical protein